MRRHVSGTLRAAGFEVHEEQFSTKALRRTGPWRYVVPLLAIGIVGAAVVAWIAGYQLRLAVELPITIAATGLLWWFAAHGVGTNIVAKRGEPRVWIVAQLGEPQPPVPEAVALAALVPGVIAMLSHKSLWTSIYVALLGIVWLYAQWRRRTRGLDANRRLLGQMGAATVLAAAERLEGRTGVGIVLTQNDDFRFSGLRLMRAETGPRDCILIGRIGSTPRLCAAFWDERPARVLEALAASIGTNLSERSEGRSGKPRIPFIDLRSGVEVLAMEGWRVVGLHSADRGPKRLSRGVPSESNNENLTETIAWAADAVARAVEAME